MKPIERTDLLDIAQYERVRESMRAEIIALKRNRRIELGPNLSLVFENRQTVLFQIQEMVRTERLVDDARIQNEIDAYQNLIPRPGELSATLFIEIPHLAALPHVQAMEAVNYFRGFDQGGIGIEAGEARSIAVFDSGFSNEEKMAAVQYLKFPAAEALRAALAEESVTARLVADNGRYRAARELGIETRRELIRDLQETP